MIFTNRFPVLFTLAVTIAGVSAQSFDQCGQTCFNTTLSKGLCSSLNDTGCVCSNTQFQNTLASCLASCSSADLVAAEELQKETCSNVSTSSSTSSSATSASSTPSGSTTSNSATAVEQLPLLSAVIVIAGALLGGTFVL